MKILTEANQITLNELTCYGDWLPYLLGLKSLSKALDKNPESIVREYNVDKWGTLLKSIKLLKYPNIDAVNSIIIKKEVLPFYFEDNLYTANSKFIYEFQFNLIKNELKKNIRQYGHLVELGAGYGSVILKLADLEEFKDMGFTACEFTDSGVECMKLIASTLNSAIEIGYCDLSDLTLKQYNIPEDAVFMTCWTMACLKGFSRSTLNEIISHNPSVVIHIEPTFEHWSNNSLLEMLWKRYTQLNDYNQTYLSDLQNYESEGLIKIVEQKKNIFGGNPLFPFSIVKWIPSVNRI